MRLYKQGDSCRVTVSRREVDEFNRRWPGSSLEGPQSFTFHENGDLVDRSGRGDGPEAVALSNDAQDYAASRGATRPARL